MEKFRIEKLIHNFLNAAKVPENEKRQVEEGLAQELREHPFRVSLIGQAGVGKTSTLNAVFGTKAFVSNIAQGQTDVEEHVFEIRDGFKLAILDFPGHSNSIEDDLRYEKVYQEWLPKSDVVVYVIDASRRNTGTDIEYMQDVVLPILKENNKVKNLIIAINKIDCVGELIDRNDPELQWDKIKNEPTKKLRAAFSERLKQITNELLPLVAQYDEIDAKHVAMYSADCRYNLKSFVEAILATERGWVWVGTVGPESVQKWSDMVMK